MSPPETAGPDRRATGGPEPRSDAPSAYVPPAVLFVERLEAQANTCTGDGRYVKAVSTLTDCTQVTSS